MRDLINIIEGIADLMAWFQGSVVVDQNGDPLRLYHGTRHDFDTYHEMSHFGTINAANERLRFLAKLNPANAKGQHVRPVYLRITNPLRVVDIDASDDATLLNARIRGSYPDLDIGTLRTKGAVAALRQAGYDGLVYENDIEDRGRDSWVPLSSDQVRTAF